MGRHDKAREKKQRAIEGLNRECDNLAVLEKDAARVVDIARNADDIFNDLDKQFEEITGLNNYDIPFLFLAVVFQVIRQYWITPFADRTSAKEGSEIMQEKYGNDGQLRGKWYYATEETIINQKKVPYDVIAGSKKYGIGKDGKGLDGNSHRFRSLGHDPVLGYIFGTANIMTNTVTWWNGTSHHIMYKPNARGILVPTIAANAQTRKIFDAVGKRITSTEGTKILVEAITKQYLHLKSDITTDGLPIPFLQSISPDFAQNLAAHGIDAIMLGGSMKQATGAAFINFIISIIHGLLCAEHGELDRSLYKVRTKKIIMYSNIIASTSNVIAVAILAAWNSKAGNVEGIKKSMDYLDLGGIVVTIYEIVNNKEFIAKIKYEFIKQEFHRLVMGNLEMEEYNE